MRYADIKLQAGHPAADPCSWWSFPLVLLMTTLGCGVRRENGYSDWLNLVFHKERVLSDQG